MNRPTTSVARHAVAYGTGSIVGGISRALLLPVIARRLSTEEFGAFSLLLAATNFLHLVFEMGLVTALIRFHHDDDRPEERRRLRRTIFLFMAPIDVLLALPFLLGREIVARLLFGGPGYGTLFALAVGVAFFAAQFQLYLGHLRAEDRSRQFALLMGAKGAISLAVTLWLVIGLHKGVGGLLLGNLAGPAVVALVMIPRHLLGSHVSVVGARARLGQLLRFGLPLVPSALGLWLLSHLDVYLLRVLADLDSVGVYSFGSEICLPVALLVSSFQLAWPSFAFARALRPDGPEEIARVFRHYLVALVGGALAIALLRREIVEVIGTRAWRDATVVIPLLALATCLYSASQIFGTGLQIARDTRRMPLYVGIAALLNAGLNVAVIPIWREVGAAAATVATNLVLCGLMYGESRRHFPIPFAPRRLIAVFAAAAGVLVAGDALGDRTLGAGLALRVPLLLLYPLLLVPAGAVSFGELRALPRVLGEIAGRRSG